ncbi:YveK family protein [Thomasclavelia sp.]|uniref:YveK family protein n=1 Tax=Thomasclavelia sp. TaxID=3025757 RepID=UPI0025FEEF67|nr:Wzz/FepE/Etk N-terminal domain-containing protein [Thomasclavelia sp.]
MDKIELVDHNDSDNDEIEIDLRFLFDQIKEYWYLVLTGALIVMLAVVGYTAFLDTPMYTSTSKVYLRGASNSVSLSDLQLNQELTSDYEIIFKSRPILENVIANLNLEYSYNELYNMISIGNPSDSRILEITVTSNNPELSMNIANETMNCSIDSVREIDSQEPYIIENAVINSNAVGYSIIQKGLLGFLVGMCLAIGAISLKAILSDTIQSIEDLENTVQLPVLCSVIEDKDLVYNKKQDKKRRRR